MGFFNHRKISKRPKAEENVRILRPRKKENARSAETVMSNKKYNIKYSLAKKFCRVVKWDIGKLGNRDLS